jgi:glutathione peroxidase
MSIYDINVMDAGQNEVPLSEYKGKVLLIVNTATRCGLTPQYEALENLYKKYSSKGFEILDFPCNQFLAQAPGTDEEITTFCQTNYGTTFRRFSKIDVNGHEASPLFVYLKEHAASEAEDAVNVSFGEKLRQIGQKFLGSDIKWNFTKFLVDRDGNVVDRFSPIRKPQDIESQIEKLL